MYKKVIKLNMDNILKAVDKKAVFIIGNDIMVEMIHESFLRKESNQAECENTLYSYSLYLYKALFIPEQNCNLSAIKIDK